MIYCSSWFLGIAVSAHDKFIWFLFILVDWNVIAEIFQSLHLFAVAMMWTNPGFDLLYLYWRVSSQAFLGDTVFLTCFLSTRLLIYNVFWMTCSYFFYITISKLHIKKFGCSKWIWLCTIIICFTRFNIIWLEYNAYKKSERIPEGFDFNSCYSGSSSKILELEPSPFMLLISFSFELSSRISTNSFLIIFYSFLNSVK